MLGAFLWEHKVSTVYFNRTFLLHVLCFTQMTLHRVEMCLWLAQLSLWNMGTSLGSKEGWLSHSIRALWCRHEAYVSLMSEGVIASVPVEYEWLGALLHKNHREQLKPEIVCVFNKRMMINCGGLFDLVSYCERNSRQNHKLFFLSLLLPWLLYADDVLVFYFQTKLSLHGCFCIKGLECIKCDTHSMHLNLFFKSHVIFLKLGSAALGYIKKHYSCLVCSLKANVFLLLTNQYGKIFINQRSKILRLI